MYPQRAAVNDIILFNAQIGELIRNYNQLLNKRVSITGYLGSGNIKMGNPFDRQDETIEFKQVFYVTNIIGWDYICGDATNDEEEVVTTDVYLWVRASQ